MIKNRNSITKESIYERDCQDQNWKFRRDERICCFACLISEKIEETEKKTESKFVNKKLYKRRNQL